MFQIKLSLKIKKNDIFIFFNAFIKLLKNKFIFVIISILFLYIYITLFFNKCYSYSLSPLKKYYAKICYPDEYKFYHFITKWSPRVIFIYQRWEDIDYYFGPSKPIYKSEVINVMDHNIKWELDYQKIIIDNKILKVDFNEYCTDPYSRVCTDDYSELDNTDINEVKKNKPYYTIDESN